MKVNYLRNLKPERFRRSSTDYAFCREVSVTLGSEPWESVCMLAHNHSMLEVIYMLEGRMSVECSGGSFTALPGDLLIFNPYEPHFGKLFGECLHVKYTVFNFEPEQLQGICSHLCDETVSELIGLTKRFDNHIPSSKLTEKLGRMISELIELEADTDGNIGAGLILYGTAVKLIGELFSVASLADSGNSMKHSRFTRAVNEFIEKNYMRPIEPDELPRLLGISRSHFCELFRKCFGTTFSDRLRDYRLDKAIELLCDPSSCSMNISEISQNVGFENYSYFARCFKRRYGVTMSEYIKHNL